MRLNKAISIRIKELLTKKAMTQYKLEQLAGLTHNTMLCVMNMRYQSCNLKTLMKIIQALNISPKDFFDSDLFDFNEILIE